MEKAIKIYFIILHIILLIFIISTIYNFNEDVREKRTDVREKRIYLIGYVDGAVDYDKFIRLNIDRDIIYCERFNNTKTLHKLEETGNFSCKNKED